MGGNDSVILTATNNGLLVNNSGLIVGKGAGNIVSNTAVGRSSLNSNTTGVLWRLRAKN